FWLRSLARHYSLTDFKSVLSDNVGFSTISISQKRDKRGTVRIVFDRFHCRRHSVLSALEIDDTVTLFVTTSAITDGHLSLTVSTTRAFYRRQQRAFRLISCNSVKAIYNSKSLARGNRF